MLAKDMHTACDIASPECVATLRIMRRFSGSDAAVASFPRLLFETAHPLHGLRDKAPADDAIFETR